jgi:lipoprotein-anchoring transpeptidase ErfK/SrfK
MKFSTTTYFALGLSLSLMLSSCVAPVSVENPPQPNPQQTTIPKAVYVNPFPEGTYAHFTADPEYPKTYDIWKDQELYNSTSDSQTRVVVDLSKQRGTLYKGDIPLLDYPISSGISSFPTEPGSYRIIEKIRSDKRSNLYGTIQNAQGETVKGDADSGEDAALLAVEGNKFVGAPMNYWMRLTWGGLGMHQGKVPRRPASHGCIRVYSKAVSDVFDKVRVGTPVKIVD